MVEKGFVKADSTNLPKINMFMVIDLLQSDDRYNMPELRGAKASQSSRENYGDSAIGYVSLRRDGPLCLLKARICPEHRVKTKPYAVTLLVNEEEENIISLECHDCAASSGGCKHAIAFLMWCNRRFESPSPTEVECYWKKSVLSAVGSTNKFITTKILSKYELPDTNIDCNVKEKETHKISFLTHVINSAKEKQLDSQLSRHHYILKEREVTTLSVHYLLIEFVASGGCNADDFLNFMRSNFSISLCQDADKKTKNQYQDTLWHELRYGRITASKIYEVAHCQKSDGSLVRSIISSIKSFDTVHMERGRRLEKQVLSVVSKQKGEKLQNSGFIILRDYPIIGASPDALGSDFIMEVKCPSSEKTFTTYVHNGEINVKYKTQMYLQMLAAGVTKGLFCVADSDFETNEKVTVIELNYDALYTQTVINKAIEFWKENIFPKLFKSVMH